MLSVTETIAKSVCSLLIFHEAKKKKCHRMLKKKKKFRFEWTLEEMQLAIPDMQQGKFRKKATAYYGVPETTLFSILVELFLVGKNSNL